MREADPVRAEDFVSNGSNRSDSFYRFAVTAGVILALGALAWGRWNLGQSRERLFALDEQQVQMRSDGELQRIESDRIDAYGAALRRSMAAEKDRSSHHYFFLSDEADRTDKRLRHARLELDRRRDLSDAKSRQAALLQRQMQVDASRSDALTVLGLILAVGGFVLWYVRRQRHLDAAVRDVGTRVAS